jgi:enoyl-CoA hydratase
MEHADFLVMKTGKIAKVIVNRQERRNAFKRSMWTDLLHIFERLAEDPEIRVILITGAGEESFAAGADISEMKDRSSSVSPGDMPNPVAEATRAIQDIEKIVIAMINGYAIGGGCEIATACDLRVASEKASIGITAARIGICISLENIKRLMDLVGASRAKDILFTGRLLPAREALSIGLVDYVVPHADLEAFTMDLATRISSNAPLSVLGAKKSIHMLSRNRNLDEVEDEFHIARKCYLSNDFQEGVRAFLEKRKPDFRGN